jgi:hypothetical protein
MKRLLLAILLLCGPWRGAASADSPPTAPASALGVPAYNVADFAAELQRLSKELGNHPSAQKSKALREALPGSWTVTTPEHAYTIPTSSLREQLAAGKTDGARLWVEHLAAGTTAYSASAPPALDKANTELEKILAEAQFGSVRPPSAWELFRERIAAWVERQLTRLFRGMSRYPIGGQILFWAIVIGAVSLIGFAVVRFLTGRDRMQSLNRGEAIAAARSWREWLRIAREEANRGDFRGAVHSGYWAGRVRLEEAGILARDRTKTPREYLRMGLAPAPAATSLRMEYLEPLTGLTRRLETVWYANRGANAEDFQNTLRELEALGCRLE